MSNDNEGKEPYPPNIDETTQGHPEDDGTDDLVINFTGDDTRERALEALKNTERHDEIEYLSAFITVINYHEDPTFNESEIF